MSGWEWNWWWRRIGFLLRLWARWEGGGNGGGGGGSWVREGIRVWRVGVYIETSTRLGWAAPTAQSPTLMCFMY